MKDKYYMWNGAALAVLLIGVMTAYTSQTLILGAAVITSYLLYQKGEKTAIRKGRTDTSKLLNSFTINLIEFLGIFSAGFLTSNWAIVFASAAVGFRESLIQSLNHKALGLSSELLGRSERILLLGLTFIASIFNEYILVYGLILIGSIALIETGRQVFLFLKQA